jgi:Ca-activated chloride channel homolog
VGAPALPIPEFSVRLRVPLRRLAPSWLLVFCALSPLALGQRAGVNPYSGSTPGSFPLVNVGGSLMSAQFERMDFAQKVLDQQSRKPSGKELKRQKELLDSGTVSALDLSAPPKAVNEFNQATALLRSQRSQEAIAHLQKATAIYPKFVSAHDYLGMAYLDADDPARARSEFETAVALDTKFAHALVNLGQLFLSQSDFVAAQANLEKAASLRPVDPDILTVLAYAQYGNRLYREAIQTVDRVHALEPLGTGNAHYVAAAAAVALNDYPTAESQFAFLLQEDPNNPLAATARYNLDILHKSGQKVELASLIAQPPLNLANSERLKTQLAGAADEAAEDACAECGSAEVAAGAAPSSASLPGIDRAGSSPDQWTIRKVVDEVAVFFGVTSGGHTVSGLELSDIRVRDDNKPPERVLQFTPQSAVPLRIGLLIDTSGSVQPRFSFEKHVATKFLQQMLGNSSDLGFVAGFADEMTVTQDFTGDRAALANGVNRLTNGGGTALFDAVSLACWKLAAFPERERVARVLVVLSDGEENAGHNSLRQTIRDVEATGVTVYTISTKEGRSVATDADKVLQTLAERSGGEVFFPGDMPTLTKSFDRLHDEIRSRYLIAYKPADFEPNGKYRTIAILAAKDGKQLHVHARKGYHARAETPAP